MRIAVLSDIHGNAHALRAVLEEMQREDIGQIWCLGDIVGYGADPNDCCALVREHADITLSGNHDLAVTGELSLDDFSRGAALAARWTREVLRRENHVWLSTLKPSGEGRGVGLYHASPRDPIWEYVLSSLLAELCLDAQEHRICLVGHSHVALSFVRREGELATGEPRRNGDTIDTGADEWLLNPGSVGQPRDGDARAAWLVLDLEAGQAQWRRTEYDVSGAQAAIRAARLPASLAERLEYGQ